VRKHPMATPPEAGRAGVALSAGFDQPLWHCLAGTRGERGPCVGCAAACVVRWVTPVTQREDMGPPRRHPSLAARKWDGLCSAYRSRRSAALCERAEAVTGACPSAACAASALVGREEAGGWGTAGVRLKLRATLQGCARQDRRTPLPGNWQKEPRQTGSPAVA
jgi:hypothetical protein